MAVNKVDINGATVIDLTGDSVTPETLLQGATAHDASGAAITGTMVRGTELQIIVTVTSGATVTATKGSLSVSGTAVNGTCTLIVPEGGVWTVTAGNRTYTTTIGILDTRTTFAASSSWYKGTTKKNTITEIHILDKYNPTGTEAENWNADESNTGNIKCYISGTILIIAGNGLGKLWANPDSSWFFCDSSYTETDEFINVTTITGLSLIDTRNMIDMSHYFEDMKNVTDLTEVYNWDVSSCTTMRRTFCNCNKITTLNLSNWNTNKVTNMERTFLRCSSLTSINISTWDTSNVTTIQGMFDTCSSLSSIDVSNWNTGNVTNMWGTFILCPFSSIDLSNWNTSKVTTLRALFNNCPSLTSIDLSNWDTSKVTTLQNLFNNCPSLTSINVSNWDTSKVTDMTYAFGNTLSLTTLDLSDWDTSNVVSTLYMFYNASKLQKIYASDLWSTDAITNSYYMFYNCVSLQGDISFNSNYLGKTYAKTSGGYLTYKAHS